MITLIKKIYRYFYFSALLPKKHKIYSFTLYKNGIGSGADFSRESRKKQTIRNERRILND